MFCQWTPLLPGAAITSVLCRSSTSTVHPPSDGTRGTLRISIPMLSCRSSDRPRPISGYKHNNFQAFSGTSDDEPTTNQRHHITSRTTATTTSTAWRLILLWRVIGARGSEGAARITSRCLRVPLPTYPRYLEHSSAGIEEAKATCQDGRPARSITDITASCQRLKQPPPENQRTRRSTGAPEPGGPIIHHVREIALRPHPGDAEPQGQGEGVHTKLPERM